MSESVGATHPIFKSTRPENLRASIRKRHHIGRVALTAGLSLGVACPFSVLVFRPDVAAAHELSDYASVMNRSECMRLVPQDVCGPVARSGQHVDMICWVGDGPLALGSRKWFDISTGSAAGFVPAPSVSDQTSVGWCGF